MQSNSIGALPRGKPKPTTKPIETGCQSGVKPAKPYPEFPLFPHASKRWAKKIRGELHYFGSWAAGPDAALEKYLAKKDALHSGRTPTADVNALTVKDVVNAFLNHKQASVDSEELSIQTWRCYKDVADLMVAEFGKRRLVVDLGTNDFAALRKAIGTKRDGGKMGLHRIAKSIQYTRSIFKYAYDAGLIDRPIRFGPGFARPSKKNFRLAKAQQIVQLFTADEIRRMLEAATLPMRAMVLLAINCAYGNTDCGTLPMSAVHLDAGWIDHARPKTGLARRCPLWPETIAALKAWLAARPTPKDEGDIGLVFVTKRGLSWAKDTTDNPVAKEMRKLMKKLELDGGRGFYALRHTHRTIADAVCDQRASDFIMGHFDPTMSAHYVERVGDERLRRVVEYVRGWLFRVG